MSSRVPRTVLGTLVSRVRAVSGEAHRVRRGALLEPGEVAAEHDEVGAEREPDGQVRVGQEVVVAGGDSPHQRHHHQVADISGPSTDTSGTRIDRSGTFGVPPDQPTLL